MPGQASRPLAPRSQLTHRPAKDGSPWPGKALPIYVNATLTPELTAQDRCDRCGAQAYVRVVLQSGSELLFCRHHAKAHDEKLRQMAAEIHDQSDKLDA